MCVPNCQCTIPCVPATKPVVKVRKSRHRRPPVIYVSPPKCGESCSHKPKDKGFSISLLFFRRKPPEPASVCSVPSCGQFGCTSFNYVGRTKSAESLMQPAISPPRPPATRIIQDTGTPGNALIPKYTSTREYTSIPNYIATPQHSSATKYTAAARYSSTHEHTTNPTRQAKQPVNSTPYLRDHISSVSAPHLPIFVASPTASRPTTSQHSNGDVPLVEFTPNMSKPLGYVQATPVTPQKPMPSLHPASASDSARHARERVLSKPSAATTQPNFAPIVDIRP